MMLNTLQRIVEAVEQAPEFDVALQAMVRRVKIALGADVCSIYLADHEQKEFVLVATDGLRLPQNKPVRLAFGEGLISLSAEREEPLNIADASKHPNYKYVQGLSEETYRAMLVSPIIHQRQVLGVIAVQHRQAEAFFSDEESFIVTLAAQLASVFAQAETREQLEQQKYPWLRSVKAVPGSAGIAIGKTYIGKPVAHLHLVVPKKTETPSVEIRRFRKAVLRTRQELKALATQVAEYVAQDTLAIFDAYQGMLDAASLGDAVENKIKEGWQAQTAVKLVVDDFVAQFESLDDPYLKERAVDVRDLGQRVLAQLQHVASLKIDIPESSILVAEEVTASMLASMPRGRIKGLISLHGSPSSHAAIMARSMGIPAVFAVDNVSLTYFEGQKLIVDGYSGDIFINPPAQVLDEYKLLYQEEMELTQEVDTQADPNPVTKDGEAIELQINTGFHLDTLENMSQALGIGLYRTEIPFMIRERFPSESEQVDLYRTVFARHQGQSVTMRTLDIGGDKPLPYFPIREENPFLGWRGIRMTLDHPEIFLVQVRAMLKANIGFNSLKILLPMITSMDEVDDSIRLIKQAYREISSECAEQGQEIGPRPEIGLMVEVPSMIYQLETAAEKVDFFSIGTNDLTQYLLAVDRNNPRVAHLYEAYHPALLRVLDKVARKCTLLQKPVSVCGELAGDPGGAILLAAMGYKTLSMNAIHINRISWILRQMERPLLNSLLEQALEAKTAEQVRRTMRLHMESLGLGGFIRVGK